MHRFHTPIAIVATLSAPALATDRYYPDSTATSPSGRYRIDAKSPDNAGGQARPFAQNFTYTLTDTTTGKVVWTRAQPMERGKGSTHGRSNEGSPMSVHVADDGLVVAHLAWDSILVLDPLTGKKRGEAEILDAFPDKQRSDFVSDTTAGPMWEKESDWFFVKLPANKDKPAQTLFVVRPYWNHRLIVDTATTKHLDLGVYHNAADPSALATADADIARVLAATMNEEASRALAILSAAPKTLKEAQAAGWNPQLRTALATVGFRRLTQAEADLRALERVYCGPNADNPKLLRSIRRSLRAIGKAPTPSLGVGHPAGKEVVSIEQRIANAPLIKPGMTADDAIRLLGYADEELYVDGQAYDFDIDASPPYTLRIYCPTGGTITRVGTITPFAFLHDPARMRGY